MASRQELLDSIQPGMKLTKNFFMKIYGYELTWSGFADQALSDLEKAGCGKARSYYQQFVGEYKKKHDEEMKTVASWFRKQSGERKVNESRRLQEAERWKEDLQQKSDSELLKLLQKLKVEKML